VDHDSELGDGVHSIATPVRNAKGQIVMAISIAGASQYFDPALITSLRTEVAASAREISALAGYTG
ncbi:MAG: IclR family transcriptional regulator C-terminal domain-containing protein, partial [Novosphingobium sp.]